MPEHEFEISCNVTAAAATPKDAAMAFLEDLLSIAGDGCLRVKVTSDHHVERTFNIAVTKWDGDGPAAWEVTEV